MARTEVWTDEIDRGPAGEPSFTVETLRRLRSVLPPRTKLWLLIGADQAANFHLWREYREVMKLAQILVALRPPTSSASALTKALKATGAWSDDEIHLWKSSVVKCDVRAVSSTHVRSAAARGDGPGLRKLVAPAVARWIEQRGLYGANKH